MKWIDLTPPEFRAAVRDCGLCVLPVGSLERHGEHGYFGTDGVIAETLAVKAAELEPAVVFPVWWFGQVHEASCFEGAINFPPEMLISMLRQLLNQIAKNGFRKICILNAHGGNHHWLQFFDMALLDEPRDYTLYLLDPRSGLNKQEKEKIAAVWETEPNHGAESETSISMAGAPGRVRLEQQPFAEPIRPMNRMEHLPGVSSGLWWYADYPENVTGCPSLASQEKGQAVMEVEIQAIARVLRTIKQDTVLPALREEFYRKSCRPLKPTAEDQRR